MTGLGTDRGHATHRQATDAPPAEGGCALSIIVLVGPGDEPRVADLDWLRAAPDTGLEFILAVTDPTRLPEDPPGRAVASPPGRGRQANRGARAARGAWLWFLHVDSVPLPGAMERARAFAGGGDAIGYAWLRFDADGPWLTHLNAFGANLRSRLLGLPYGDQGLLLPRERFRELGGFREDQARGEDLDLVVRARRQGLRCAPIGATVRTSARRYRQQGWLRTTLHHGLAAVGIVWRAWRAAGPTR